MSYNYVNHDYGFGPSYNFQPHNQPKSARYNLSSFNGNQPNISFKLPPNSFRERNRISSYENKPHNSFNTPNPYGALGNRNNYHHENFVSFSQNYHSGGVPNSFSHERANQIQQYPSPPSLPFLNLENVKQRKIQHSKSQNHYPPSFSNLGQNSFGTTLETQLNKQNKVLSQIHGMLARQGQFDQQKHKVEMAQRFKELQYDRLVVHQELERQKSTRLQALTEVNKPEKAEEKKNPKKEKSIMRDIILDIIFHKAQKRNKNPIRDSEQNTPSTITLRHSNSERKRYHQNQSNGIPFLSTQSHTQTAIVNQENNRSFRTNSNISGVDLNRNLIQSLQEGEEDTSAQLDLNFNPLSESKDSIGSVEEEGLKSVERSKTKKQKRGRYKKTKSFKGFKNPILEENDYEIVSANKEQRRKKARYRLMSLSWLLLYGKFLYQEKKKATLLKREEFDSKISSILAQIHQMFYEHIIQSVGKEILAMLKDTNHSYIFTDPLVKQKKSEQKSAALLVHLTVIFNKLIVQVSLMPAKVFDLLKLFLIEDAFLPNDYFTTFELTRMKFGAFGTIREMHSGRIKLLIGSIFLARIVLHSIIMHPWDAFNQSKAKFKIEKILNIGSILYHALIIVLKSTVPSYQNNQSFLPLDLRIRPKKKLLQAIDDPHAENVFHIEKDQSKDGDIIDGFYAKHQLRTFFEDNKPEFEELKSLINGCLDVFYERISAN